MNTITLSQLMRETRGGTASLYPEGIIGNRKLIDDRTPEQQAIDEMNWQESKERASKYAFR